jgi:predicted RND superfamily exporter protein
VGVKLSAIQTDDIPRPSMGVKNAKAERDGKGKNKQVSKDMEELDRYIEAQEEASKNRTAVLEVQKRISQDKVEASRLALEAAKENKEAKTKAKMLEQYTKLLTHDTSGMPDDMKAEHLKAISLMRETLWGKTHQS